MACREGLEGLEGCSLVAVGGAKEELHRIVNS